MRISDWSSDVCSSDLAESELVALLEWAASSGDLLSRIGAIETGLAVLPRIPSLEPTILALVTSIRDLDPTDVEGRLHFLMGILLYVGGDISRTGVLADLPPFQRRLAIFAQAALFERSEEHTSELQSLMRISYAVFCLKKKKETKQPQDSKV